MRIGTARRPVVAGIARLVAVVVAGGLLVPSPTGALAAGAARTDAPRQAGRAFAPPESDEGTVLVRFAEGTTKAGTEKIAKDAGATAQQVVGVETHVLKVKEGQVLEAIRRLRAHPLVAYAEPNYLVRPDVVPDDPSFGELWGLRNTGQVVNGAIGTPGAGIDAPSAWNVTTGSKKVVVGVIDSGIDAGHPDLASNVWSNPGLVNGCGPGTHGYNFVSGNCFPSDDNGHGTHVAGTIGAAGNDGTGVTGVNWSSSLMALKFIRPNGAGLISDAVAAIDFAVAAKLAGVNVRVLNASWGGSGRSQALLDAIEKAAENDIVVVASAGNGGGVDIPHFPCNFRVENLLCVGASDQDDHLAPFSNSGSTVDLAAPGTHILSTGAGGGYVSLDGTSMATPHVTGAAALTLANCARPAAELRSRLLATVDLRSSLTQRVVSGGRLNVAAAVGPPGCDPGFYLAASPSVLRVPVASPADVSLSLLTVPVGGFSGVVDLEMSGLPAGATATLGPSRVFVTDPGSTASTVTVRTVAGTAAGSYTLTITGNDGLMARATAVDLRVQEPDFVLDASPDPAIFPGEVADIALGATPRAGYSGVVDLTVEGLPPASSATFAPTPISLGGTAPSFSVLSVATTGETPAGTYELTVHGAGEAASASVVAPLTVRPPDFAVVVDDASQSVLLGESATYAATVSSQGGFSGTVALGVEGAPPGSAATFEPNPVEVAAHGSVTATLTVPTTEGTSPGRHSFSITASAGPLSHTVGVTLDVQPRAFAMSVASPPSRVVGRASTATFEIGLASTDFTGSVDLIATDLPAGTTAAFSTNPVALVGGATATSSLAVTSTSTTPFGTHTFTVAGTGGPDTRDQQASLIVEPPAFVTSASPASRQVAPGAATSYTLTTGSTFGFSGKVGYSLTGLPAGASGAFSLNPVSLSGAAQRTSSLSITTSAGTPPGHYALSITGTKGASVRKRVVTLNVVPPPPAPLGVTAMGDSESRINVWWDPVPGATSYKVYRSATVAGEYSHVASVTSTSYASTSLAADTAYFYVVRAVGGTATSASSLVVSATTATGPGAPDTPTDVAAGAVSPASIDLSWTAVSGATGYRVFRSAVSGGPYTKIGAGPTPGFSDGDVQPRTAYYYVVRAFSDAGTSGTSSELAVETPA